MLIEAGSLVLVALLWGGTNPLLRKNSKDIVKIKSDSRFKQFLLELKYLALNTKYLIPMALNQSGSVIYFLTLQKTDLTLTVPVANSLTFVFTAISGWLLGEKPPTRSNTVDNTILGVICILIGTTLCCYDNYLVKEKEINKQPT